jgi:chitodextrinase
VGGLDSDTRYWFALKTADEEPNWSDLSNVPDTTTSGAPDETAPAAVTLSITGVGNSWVELTWTAPGDDGTGGGEADAYDVRYSTGVIDTSNFDSATQWTAGVPSPGTPGTPQEVTISGLSQATQYWFAMKTRDEVPNWSDISNVPDTTTTTTSVTPGDMNGDDQLTVADLTLMVSLILEDSTFTAADSTVADMNIDSSIDILDVVLLIGDILGLDSPQERDIEELLALVSVDLAIDWMEGGVVGVSVGLTGSHDVGGMEFWLRYDRSAYELVGITPGSDREGLNISYRDNGEAVKILVYAPNGSDGIGDGDLFGIDLRPFDHSFSGTSGIRVEKVILSDLWLSEPVQSIHDVCLRDSVIAGPCGRQAGHLRSPRASGEAAGGSGECPGSL